MLTLEVWSKLAKCVRIMRSASKCASNFDCDWQRVNEFFHCVTLIRILLLQIISYSDTKVLVLVVMECKRANVIYVYELPYFKVNRVCARLHASHYVHTVFHILIHALRTLYLWMLDFTFVIGAL